MIKVRIDFADGEFSLVPVGPEETGGPIVEMTEAIWRAYLGHLDQCQVWHDLIRRMDDKVAS